MGKIYKQLSIEERTLIQTQLSMGFKPSQIARELGRSSGTLSRELKHNGGYVRGCLAGLADLQLREVIVPM
jgi:IS30 family transposase